MLRVGERVWLCQDWETLVSRSHPLQHSRQSSHTPDCAVLTATWTCPEVTVRKSHFNGRIMTIYSAIRTKEFSIRSPSLSLSLSLSPGRVMGLTLLLYSLETLQLTTYEQPFNLVKTCSGPGWVTAVNSTRNTTRDPCSTFLDSVKSQLQHRAGQLPWGGPRRALSTMR